MGRNTQRYHKWAGYTVSDCSCEFCLFFAGRKRQCLLPSYYCADEREEAIRR